MCGIAGYVGHGPGPDLPAMLAVMAHRGPDGSGAYASPGGRCVLGHVRLAVIDPAGGAQPLGNEDSGLQVVFNGCIYNYLELRSELASFGHTFRTRTDTEVIVHAYEQWGRDCLARFNGMFAFALWDDPAQQLFCARDRVGVKPFAWWAGAAGFLFASEIKALLASGLFPARPDLEAMQEYLVLQAFLGEGTLFAGVRRLLPGCWLSVGPDGRVEEQRRYWSLDFTPDEGHDEQWFVRELRSRLRDSARLQIRSDVPLGTHLSGGLDSTAVLCLAREALGNGSALDAFCGAFGEGPAYDESAWAKIAADADGARLYLVQPGPEDFQRLLPRIIWHMDEPVAGPGLFPQYMVSALARERVTVVLGGQGGDEIFAGYARYLVAYLEQCLKGAMEKTADTACYAATLASLIPSLPMLRGYEPMLQRFFAKGLFGPQERRYFHLLDRSDGLAGLYSGDLLGGEAFRRVGEQFASVFNGSNARSYLNRMLHTDFSLHLPALLHVEDRTSMAVGLESRVPLLDHRICELLAQAPPAIKFKGGRPKHLFREALQGIAPQPILEREDKMGFPVPLARWLRGPLREFAGDHLLDSRARQRGLFDPDALERLLDGEGDYGRALWGALNLELWHRTFIDG